MAAIDWLKMGSFLAARIEALTWNDFLSSLSALAAMAATLGLTAGRLRADRRGEVVLEASESGVEARWFREGVDDVFLDVSRRTSSRSSRSSIS